MLGFMPGLMPGWLMIWPSAAGRVPMPPVIGPDIEAPGADKIWGAPVPGKMEAPLAGLESDGLPGLLKNGLGSVVPEPEALGAAFWAWTMVDGSPPRLEGFCPPVTE